MTGGNNAVRRYADNDLVECRMIRSQVAAGADGNEGLIAQAIGRTKHRY